MIVYFRIPVFDNELVKIEDRIFKITFLAGNKWNLFRICVDGKLSNQTISVLSYDISKKEKYLLAIQYVLYTDKKLSEPKSSKFLTIDKIKQIYSKGILKSIQKNLLETFTEQSRDILTKYNLVFIQ